MSFNTSGRVIDGLQVIVLNCSGKLGDVFLSVMVFIVATEVSLSVWAISAFTPTEINTTLVTIVALVTALGIAAVNIIVAWRTSNVVRETSNVVKDAKQTIDVVAKKTERIEESSIKTEAHVNSEKTADQKTIEGLRREIVIKQQVIDEKDRAAALLAQSAATALALAQATTVTIQNAPASPVVSSAEVSLTKINEDTSAIKDNTAKTDAIVQELKDKA